LNKEYFFNIFEQPNENIRIIEGILDNLNRSFESIDDFVDENINTIISDTKSIEKNLKFIEKITEYFMTYKRFLNLTEEEKPIYAISAKLSNGLNNQEIFKKKSGMLFITNLDLSFIHEYGWIKKKQDLIFKAPVSDLIRIKEKGTIFKKLYIEFAYGKYEFSMPDNDSISRVIEYILLARNYDETAIFDKDSARKLNNIEISLKKLKNFIEEGINSFYSLKCQSNNTNIKDLNEIYSGKIPGFLEDREESRNNENQFNPYNNPNYYQRFSNMNPKENYQSFSPQDLPFYFGSQPYEEYSNSNNPNNPICHYDGGRYRNPSIESKRNVFFLQNLQNPNRFQNYNPEQFMRKMYQQRQADYNKKALLMKQLEKQQRLGSENFMNPSNYNNLMNEIHRDANASQYPFNPRSFQDYNKIHKIL
jgi:hypothetical protein